MRNAEADKDRKDYAKALISGDHDRCAQIEQKYGLFGWPPEIVSIGLNAEAICMSADDAIADYMNGSES